MLVCIACLLLPFLSVLLLVMDRIEERVFTPAPVRRRHAAHRRHLRLIPGGRGSDGAGEAPAATGADDGSAVRGPRAA
ncbi:hypothetical protein ABZT08_28445 [Streptomyces sp. NPDC005526]|uniref:hypothetical protein n=1 Tax=Streptomyces sp. NPDC005526 TaxID=3156885 RepID=UPI0033A2F9DC